MAETKRMTAEQVVSYLREEDGVDFLRESLRWVVQQLMEVEVSGLIGASTASAAQSVWLTETATGRGAGTRAPPRSSSRSRRSAAARISRLCSSRGGGPSRR